MQVVQLEHVAHTRSRPEVQSAYVIYSPDYAVRDAIEVLAKELGLKPLVLPPGRGEEVAQRCEGIVQRSGLEWTISNDPG